MEASVPQENEHSMLTIAMKQVIEGGLSEDAESEDPLTLAGEPLASYIGEVDPEVDKVGADLNGCCLTLMGMVAENAEKSRRELLKQLSTYRSEADRSFDTLLRHRSLLATFAEKDRAVKAAGRLMGFIDWLEKTTVPNNEAADTDRTAYDNIINERAKSLSKRQETSFDVFNTALRKMIDAKSAADQLRRETRASGH